MKIWSVVEPGPVSGRPLVCGERAEPEPGPGEIQVQVSVCGVCRTDLHLAEGDLTPRRPGVVPGHEVVGVVRRSGPGAERFAPGTRVGIPWLASTCGRCAYCRAGRENLCSSPRFTGWDLDGGFAELVVANEDFVYALPESFDDRSAAPLLCAGIIGYRSLRRARLPAGGRLGIYGFGASAHLTLQVAVAEGAEVHVMTRSADAQRLALDLGAASAQGAADAPPRPLDSAILFAPVGDLVLPALEALDRGGTLAVAGIHLSDIPPLHYQDHLFLEKTLTSVTANTRGDGEEFLARAAAIGLRPTTTLYPFDRTDAALADLAADRVNGAAVIAVDG
ncbi:MAG: zinc-dependent alcohol dehydrogenase family protein [Acidobacteriota bacterium]|nr:zinc-dependent alcohol dehydrogenase family protein [Acidobacteriota bacterium]